MFSSLCQKAAPFFLMAAILIVSCQDQPEEIAIPISPTAVVQMATTEPATPAPTALPTPTATIAPAPTEPAPTPTADPLANVASGWRQYSNANFINALTVHDNILWAGTGGGLVAWDLSSDQSTKYTTANGLLDNEIHDVIFCNLGEDFIITASRQGLSLLNLATSEWQQWTFENTGMVNRAVNALACMPDEPVLFVGYDYAGVDRYDAAANAWTNYNRGDGDLAHNLVVDMVWVPQNEELWVTSSHTISILIGRSVQFPDDPLPYDGIQGMSVDGNGQVWLGTRDGLIRGSGNGFWQQYDVANSIDFPQGEIRGTAVNPDGTLWIGSNNGEICLFNPTSATCEIYYDDEPGMVNGLHALTADETGTVFYGRRHSQDYGVSVLQGGVWRQLLLDEMLASNEIHDIVQDSGGFIWVGTTNGAHRFDPTNDAVPFETFTRQNSGLTHDHVDAIVPDGNGGIWFGGYGVSYFDGSRWTPYMEEDGLIHDDVFDMALTADGRLWIATAGGISIWDGTNFNNLVYETDLPTDDINRLLPQGNVMWAATGDNGLLRFADGEITVFNEDNSALTTNFLVALAPDVQPGSLLTGMGGDLVSIDEDGRIAVLPEVQGGFITDIQTTAAGEIWVGTQDGGAFYYNGSSWQQFTTDDGLTSNRLGTVYADSFGTIWFGGESNGRSGGGLSRWVP